MNIRKNHCIEDKYISYKQLFHGTRRNARKDASLREKNIPKSRDVIPKDLGIE
jgi:hypothetical protein